MASMNCLYTCSTRREYIYLSAMTHLLDLNQSLPVILQNCWSSSVVLLYAFNVMHLTQFVVLHLSNLHYLLNLKAQSPMASMDCPYIWSTRREYISECNDPFAEFKSITSGKPTELPNYSVYCHVHLPHTICISVIYTICWYLKHSLHELLIYRFIKERTCIFECNGPLAGFKLIISSNVTELLTFSVVYCHLHFIFYVSHNL